MAPAWLNNGFPPEVQEDWTIIGVLMEGTLPLRPGVLFFAGLFVGLTGQLHRFDGHRLASPKAPTLTAPGIALIETSGAGWI